MAEMSDSQLWQLPEEMLKFILESSPELTGLRLGRVLSLGRDPIATPHYVAATSRGVVPHVAQDMMQRHTNIKAVYMGLEDFIEKSASHAPILKFPAQTDESILRRYTALPPKCLSILGARRVPRISCPAQNTNSSISISTSVGFRFLQVEEYQDADSILKPDVSISIADLITADTMSKKRIERSADRTHAWLRDTIARAEQQGGPKSSLFAAVLPLEVEEQQLYLQDLADDFKPHLSGLTTYTPQSIALLPLCLSNLPRLCISDPQTPQELLHAISLGVDLITVPLVSATSEKGLAFAFLFPPPTTPATKPQPLILDMWAPAHATSVTPIVDECQCYTCTSHHRAYLHHLLQAKEMLAWTLLQFHNYHVLDKFFEGVRNSIKANTFDVDAKAFRQYYEAEMVPGEGKDRGPRVRGYQMKSIGGDPKKNAKQWGRFENGETHEITTGADEAAVDRDLELNTVEIEKLGLAEITEK